jgi:uncharacterized MAPEG superfamily protein
MSELACLEVAVLLWIVHVLLQANTSGAPPAYLFSSRDEAPPPPGTFGARAARASRNYMDNFPPFAALVLAFLATNHPAGIWPTIWILARIAYLPLYLFNGVYARTAAWLISIIALVAMLIRLAL